MMIIISFTGKDGVANETDSTTERLKLYASAKNTSGSLSLIIPD